MAETLDIHWRRLERVAFGDGPELAHGLVGLPLAGITRRNGCGGSTAIQEARRAKHFRANLFNANETAQEAIAAARRNVGDGAANRQLLTFLPRRRIGRRKQS
jgi:hypothetical protein